ncbi:MAG: molybdopterin-dependent oxidoreductase [Spirochaetes bacterium]|nr:molybdopterin-dependent oxidoreductase [Spirochaetota bacterium]
MENGEIKTLRNTCPLCPEHDSILISVADGEIVEINGDTDNPFTNGHICSKGRNADVCRVHPDRVIHPLKRIKKQWVRVSWDDALNEISERTHRIREMYGPLAFAAADANTNTVPGVALGLFMRSLGSPNLMSNLDLCAGPGIASDLLSAGDQLSTYFSVADFRNAGCIFIAGSNIAASHPRQWEDAKKAVAEGAKLIVVDPRHTEIAERADLWLQIRPGSDGALAMGMLNVILNENLYDREFVTKWCVGFERLNTRIGEYPPERVEKMTWITADDIRKAARLYATVKPACLRANLGVQQRNNSFPAARAFSILPAVTGNIDIPGGQLLARFPSGPESNSKVAEEYLLPRDVVDRQIGASEYPLWSGNGSIVTKGGYANISMTLRAMITGRPYRVKAWFIMNPNAVVTYPDTKLVLDAIKNLELVVVCTDFMTPTAEMADFILPRAHPFETDRIIGTSHGQWVLAARKAVEPKGECRDDIKIFHELSKKMLDKRYLKKSLIPWKDIGEYNEYRLKRMGITFNDLQKKGIYTFPMEFKKYEREGFATPSGRFEIYSGLLEKYGYDPLPYYRESPSSEVSNPQLGRKYPLLLISSRKKDQYLSRSHIDGSTKPRISYPELEIHPHAASDRGIADGDRLWIETPKGRCMHTARITDKIHPAVVNGCFGWWFPRKPAPEHGCLEANINMVMAYEPPHDPVVGINSVQGVVCEVYKVVP